MSEWISVKERLPQVNKIVLVAAWVDGGVGLGYAYVIELAAWSDMNDWCGTSDVDYFLDDITHWMPLPEPPENDSHDK